MKSFLAIAILIGLSAKSLFASDATVPCVDRSIASLEYIEPISAISSKIISRCGDGKLDIGQICITSKGFQFKLVDRTKDGKELFADLSTGILWGDKVSGAYKFSSAQKACEEQKSTYVGDVAYSKLTFELPKLEDFYTGEEHGFREVLPGSGHSYTTIDFPSLSDKVVFTHQTYWTADTYVKPILLGTVKLNKAYAYKMAKDYYEAFEMPGDSDASYMSIRCIARGN